MSSLTLKQSAAPSSNLLWAGTLSLTGTAAIGITANVLDASGAYPAGVDAVGRVKSSLAGNDVLNAFVATGTTADQLLLSCGTQVVAQQVQAVGETLLINKGTNALTLTPSASSIWDVQIYRLQYQP